MRFKSVLRPELLTLLSAALVSCSCSVHGHFTADLAAQMVLVALLSLKVPLFERRIALCIYGILLACVAVMSWFGNLLTCCFCIVSATAAAVSVLNRMAVLLSPKLIMYRINPKDIVSDSLLSVLLVAGICFPLLSVVSLTTGVDPAFRYVLAAVAAVCDIVLLVCVWFPLEDIVSDVLSSRIRATVKATSKVVEREMSGKEADMMLFAAIDRYLRTDLAFLDRPVGEEDLAAHFHTNRTYISSAVNACTNSTYSDYINSVRIEYARKLAMANPFLTVSQLAHRAGYNVPTTFTMAFKRLYGMPPGEWLLDLRALKKK